MPDINKLKKEYFVERQSTRQLAEKYAVTKGAVRNKLARYNIELRTLQEAQDIIANHLLLSKEAIDYLNGLLLGDGCVVQAPTKKSSCYIHSDKHKQYLQDLIEQFKQFDIFCSEVKKHSGAFSIRTRYYRELNKLRYVWYPNGKKKVPKNIELTPETIKNWYIGDGTFYTRKNGMKQGERLMLYMEYDTIGRKKLSEKLEDLGIYTSIYFNGLYVKARSRKCFFDYMLSQNNNIPISYQYKFPKCYCGGSYGNQ